MPVRDLGYKPYEGDRLPPSNNTKVMLRHGLRRAWGSWLVKIAAFAGWIPMLVGLVMIGGYFYISRQSPQATPLEPDTFVRSLFVFQLWLFVTLITLGAGSGVIAQDLTHRAFQFYFSKPVTAAQYLTGRVAAVAIWCFVLTFVPAVFVVLALAAIADKGEQLSRVGLLFPCLVHALLIATVSATASIGVSSISRSRALTMSAWIMLFLLPEALALIVWKITDWPWLRLLSLPSLLEVVGDALFRLEPESAMHWYHSLPVLAAVVVGCTWLALYRVRRAEVIT